MKTNWIKLSYILLGASLVFGSCVKTEESDEVIELRKAAAAKINADAAFRLAEVKYQEAEASSRIYQAKYDSAKYKGQIEIYAIQAQRDIQEAKNQLLSSQISFEMNTKALEVEKLNNPLLAALVSDYTAYYNGGYLSDGSFISDGIFDLQSYILDENGTIISLQTSKEGLAFLVKGKEIQLGANNTQLADLQSALKILSDARTSGNYDAALTSARDLLVKSTAEYNKLKIAYDNADNQATTTLTQYDAASNLYNQIWLDKLSASSDLWDILDNYSTSNDQTVAYNAFMSSYNTCISNESKYQTLLSTWTNKYQTAVSEKNNAQTAFNSAKNAYLAAQAVVDAATINGGVATTAQINDRNAKLTTYNNATTTYNTKVDDYNAVALEYEDAQNDFENAKESADLIRTRLTEYNIYKESFDVADAKLPSLKTDMDNKSIAYYKLAHSRDSIETLYDNAEEIKGNDEDVVSLLENNRNDINDEITDIESDINDINEDIAVLTKEIANLKAGIDVNNGDVLIDDQIKISQNKVKMWSDILTKYQSLATALKVKIDAQ